jgi:hypothetical protein
MADPLRDIEKGTESSTTVGATSHTHAIHGHQIHTGRRLRHFLHPSGHKVHVASSPDEAEKMKRHLSVSEPEGFDLVIHGSADHVSLLFFGSDTQFMKCL